MSKLEESKLVNKEDLIEALDDAAYMTMKRDILLKEYDSIKKSPENFQEQTLEGVNELIVGAGAIIQ
jgi:hypothetical protein